jgi:hypothetical protein
MQAAEEENWSSIRGWLENDSISIEVKKKIVNTQKRYKLFNNTFVYGIIQHYYA